MYIPERTGVGQNEAETPMSDTNNQTSKPTRETYDPLQLAYETLNRALFENSLPNALITLQRRKRTYGYFIGDRFARAWPDLRGYLPPIRLGGSCLGMRGGGTGGGIDGCAT